MKISPPGRERLSIFLGEDFVKDLQGFPVIRQAWLPGKAISRKKIAVRRRNRFWFGDLGFGVRFWGFAERNGVKIRLWLW